MSLSYTSLRFLFCAIVIFFNGNVLFSQNIAPNPSFEVFTHCPITWGQGGPLPATPWSSATAGTSDYFHECHGAEVDVPDNYFGYEPAHTGVAYGGGYYRYNDFVYREYLLAPLTEPLVAGEYYYVSWWTSLGDTTCGVDQLGAYFSVNPPPGGGVGPIDVDPQIVANLGFVSEDDGWTLIEGCFMAAGGETYITIGNFSEEEDTPIDPDCTIFTNTSYYYVDDVTVEQGPPPGTIDFDLGGPFEACYTYDVEAPIPDAIYTWSDGSHGQILTVTESGIYTLTISDGCSTGTDDVEVTILGSPAVEIGPAEAMLCIGDSYDISLDPDAGTYAWQDGSTDSDYSITTSGLYSVTLDDGCHETIDQILVEVVDSPDPFDLGVDTYLCDGDQIEYNFDPELGDFLWQDNSTSSDYVITEPGTYSLTISNVCGESTDEINIELIEEPDFTLGPDQLFLCDGDTYEIELDEEMGDFIWQDGSTLNFYSITDPGLYAVTVSNECGSNIQDIEVFFYPLPVVDLGDDLNLCPAQLPIILDAGDDPDVTFLWQDGSDDSQHTVTDAGIYSVTVSNGCDEVSDVIQILVEDAAPEVILPADQLLCDEESITLDADFIIGDYEWQDGSTDEQFVVTSPGVYTVTVTNECGSDADTVVIDFIPAVTPPDLGPDVVLCPAQLPIVLSAGNDPNVTYDWQDGSGGSTYTVTDAGFYSVTVSNGCEEESDVIEVVVEDGAPDVALPADQLLCQTQSYTLTAGNIAGQYEWQDGSTGFEYIVTTPGTYTLTVTNVCGSDADTVVVNYIPAISAPNLGPDVTLCPGEAYIFYATTTGVNYNWSDGSHADSLLVNTSGTYWLNIADACTSATDSVNVTIGINPPAVDLPSSLPLCNNAFITIDAGISGVDYLWNDGTQGPSILVGSPGTYSITVSNACGSDVDTVYVTDAGPAPSVDLGNDIDICNGDVVNLSPVFSNVNTWLWNDGSTGQTYSITQAGTISVEVTNSCGDDTDMLIVSLLPDIPPIDLGGDTALCAGESFSLSITSPGVNILWSDGSTGPDLQVSSPGLVYATITNQCGAASDSVLIDALPAVPPLDLGIDQSLCPGEIITLSPGIPNVDYLWNDGSTGTTFNTTTPGEIILTISNDCGTATDTIDIIENNNAPQVNLGADILACEGDVVTLSSDISGVNYLWQDGSTLADFSTTSSGTFTLQVSNACGQDKDTVIVNINGSVPSPDLGPDITLCDGASVQLISAADAITSVEWQDGSSLLVFNVSSPGEYILSESNHCGDVSDTINIAYLSPPPAIDLGPDKTLCPGEAVTLAAPTTTATITWQDGTHGATFIADQSLVYTLQLSNDCGTTTDDFELTIDTRSPLINLADQYPWCPESVFSFDVTQPFTAEYLWNDGSVLPTIQIAGPGIYSVVVLTDCKTVDHELEVFESDTCIRKDDFYVPNVFTPNGDQKNDYFEVFTGPELDVISMKCSIYDRWGNLVFGSNTEPIRWDGSFQNKLMNPAVFTYIVYIRYLQRGVEKTHVIPGQVTLIR